MTKILAGRGFVSMARNFAGVPTGCIYDYEYMRVRVCIVPRVANTEFDRGQTQPTCWYICQLVQTTESPWDPNIEDSTFGLPSGGGRNP